MARKKTGSQGLLASADYSRMLNMILESAKIRTDIIDSNFKLVFVDSLTRKELGDVGGRFCYEYFRGKTKPCPGCVIKEAARKGTAQSAEIYNEQENKWKKITAIPFRDKDGRELFSEIKIDISDYVKSKDIFESLSRGYEEREERYKALFNNAKIAWFVAEASTGIIVDVNQEAEKLSGRTRQELIGLDRIKLHPPEDEKFYREQFKTHVVHGNILAAEAVVCRKDGKRVPVEISAVISDSGGKKYIQGLFADISKRKKAEEELLRYQAGLEETVRERTADLKAVNEHLAAQSLELEKARQAAEQASRLKSEFIASMSHELGTPLNAINGFSMVLMNGKFGELNKKQSEYMQIIRESVNLLVSLVDEALDLSKIEAGKYDLRRRRCPSGSAPNRFRTRRTSR